MTRSSIPSREFSTKHGEGRSAERGVPRLRSGRGQPAPCRNALAIAGVGQGVYAGVDYALVTGVLPNSDTEAAKGTGVFNMANSLPRTVEPMLAPALLTSGGGENRTTLYPGAAVFAASGSVALRFLRLVR
ncbi:hypothetical protein FHR84_000905 [Actinopolyspora biskrensis]|uniref:MFS transporter n=1 Tax=Actinopolyspora biskrensis TaxID=1470178 RepID=A0A852YS99_9ACTN|nr:hypothetical protein [Actinopolyspora biskrensis]NYH77591.1 hypothetical protein [Actinopolyspora biskrensis]